MQTDVLTAVPFIIKGFELLRMAQRRRFPEVTWFAGTKTDPIMVAESWVAECQVMKVDSIGAVFIGIGFTILIFGILTEFQAARLRKKWTKDGVLVIPPKLTMFLALLGQDRGEAAAAEALDEEGRPFFDPDNELAAFAAQQQATLGNGPNR